MMIEAHYNRRRLISQAIGMVVFAAVAGWVALLVDMPSVVRLLAGFLAICLPFAALACSRRVLDGKAAVAESAQGLEIASLYAEAQVPWSQLISLQRSVLQRHAALGLIKQHLAHYLVCEFHDGAGTRTIKVQEDLLLGSREDHRQLYEHLVTAMHNQGSVRMRPAPLSRAQPAGGTPRQFGRRTI